MKRARKNEGASQEIPSVFDEDRLSISATTFLLLCLWLGPQLACWLIAIVAIVAMWIALCRRFPFLGHLTVVFVGGFVSGLVGGRTPYRRRRRISGR
jgi:hypothetical protein